MEKEVATHSKLFPGQKNLEGYVHGVAELDTTE